MTATRRPPASLEGRIIAALRSAGGPCTRGQLQDLAGLTSNDADEFAAALRALLVAGSIMPAVVVGSRHARIKALPAFEYAKK